MNSKKYFSSRVFSFLTILLLCISLYGCATVDKLFNLSTEESDPLVSAQNMAVQAMKDYDTGKYFSAAEQFDKIIELYPFSPQAMLAELKTADCKYYMAQYEEAGSFYLDFEERHPTNEAIPYVIFQIGMCDYNRIDRIDRDISGAQKAIKSFSRLRRTYPDSPYAEEAFSRLKAAQEFLVNHEYFVTMFYIRSEKYNQAETRLRYLISSHPDSKIAPKAKKLLARLESGNPPKKGIKDWFPDFSLPDWKIF